jgi:hypothetical protein
MSILFYNDQPFPPCLTPTNLEMILNYKYTLSDPRLSSLCSNPTDYLTGQTPVKSSIRIGGQALPLVGLRGNPDEIHSAPLNKSSKFNSLNISFWAGIHLGKHHFC